VRTVGDATPTAAVALTPTGIQLRVNPHFFMNGLKSQSERVAVIKHEVLHLVFKHLFRHTDERSSPFLLNLAADLVVNQLIGRYWSLPRGAILLSTFPDLELERNQTLHYYYDKLATLSPKVLPMSARVLDKLRNSTWHSDHGGWLNSARGGDLLSELVSPALRDAMEDTLERLIVLAKERAGAKSWSSLPGPIQSLVTAILEKRKPKVHWRRALRLFAASSRRTRIVATQRRESRRYDTIPGIKVKQLQRLAVAIDTSGSVPDSDLSDFFAEIHGMWRHGAEVQVIECDATVHRTYPYRGRLPDFVAGRGGTAFDPVFAHLRRNRLERYDGCIYLTDGFAPAPKIKPPCRLLWVVTPDGNVDERLRFGRVIQLP